MLIPSNRPTRADLDHWRTMEELDLEVGPITERKAQSAIQEIEKFSSLAQCYAGVSWGKDSVVIAHLIARAHIPIPLVWVRVMPIVNPDCYLVRDAFLNTHPNVQYQEVEVWCRRSSSGWHATGTLEQGFAIAAGQTADRYVSGIRAEESKDRKMRMLTHGVSTARTCAPITRWTGIDVFAYLAHHGLPVHPAYACTHGGSLDRTRIRVASLGGQRGTGKGRAEWERRYYRAEIAALEDA